MDANYFESPAPSPCHPVMGNVIGLFANRAKRGIVLVETFSISQKGLNPPLKALSCSGYICSSCRAGIVQKPQRLKYEERVDSCIGRFAKLKTTRVIIKDRPSDSHQDVPSISGRGNVGQSITGGGLCKKLLNLI